MESDKKFTNDKAILDKCLAEEKEWNQVAIFDNKFKVITTSNTAITEDEMKYVYHQVLLHLH
jgi:hypothetical protein